MQEWEGCNSGLQGDQSVVETDAHLDVSNTVAGGKGKSFLEVVSEVYFASSFNSFGVLP